MPDPASSGPASPPHPALVPGAVAVVTGGAAGIGLAAGLTDPNAGLGAVGGYAALSNYTNLGGQLTVFTLPN